MCGRVKLIRELTLVDLIDKEDNKRVQNFMYMYMCEDVCM